MRALLTLLALFAAVAWGDGYVAGQPMIGMAGPHGGQIKRIERELVSEALERERPPVLACERLVHGPPGTGAFLCVHGIRGAYLSGEERERR